MKYSKIIILVLLFIIIYSLYNQIYSSQKELFENITIVSRKNNSVGFYSQLFFLINHYIYCKENKQNFKIDSENWIYKSKDGWTDYFKPIELKYYESNGEKVYEHQNTIDDYSIESYKNIIPEIYVYNESVIDNIEKIKQKLMLDNYDAIYIRRGDKLIDEIKISQESNYIDLLLKKNPNCKTIFLQTDDYTCFTNLQKYIDDKVLNIRLVTICKKNSVGAITSNDYKNKFDNSIEENVEYISSIREKIQNTKPIQDMNRKQKYKHTLELLTGVDICMHSNICICDYDSNVSRFIKLAHDNTNNVFDINNTIIDFNKKICPGFSF